MKQLTPFLILVCLMLANCGGEADESVEETSGQATSGSSDQMNVDATSGGTGDENADQQTQMAMPVDVFPHPAKKLLREVLHDAKPNRKLTAIMAPAKFHGIHGLTFNRAGDLLVGSVVGQSIHKVNVNTGDVVLYKAPPYGLADDLVEGPDGLIVWTSFLTGVVYAQKPNGPQITVASGLPGINSLDFNDQGRLFATQVFAGDALYELDPTGNTEPRKIIEGMGGLNGFDFGPDGKLYGPLWFKQQVVSVDVDTGEITVVAEGFGIPAAVNFDSQGNLYAIDTQNGEVIYIDRETGEKELVAELEPALDNLAIDASDNIYVTNMADNGIVQINPATGDVQTIVYDGHAAVSDIAMLRKSRSRDELFVANVFSANSITLKNGDVEEIGRVFGSELEYPLNVAVGDKLVLFSSNSAGTVHIYTTRGNYVNSIHGLAGILDVLPLDRDTFAYINANNASLVITSYDNPTEPLLSIGGFNEPSSIIFEDDDHVLVSDRKNGTISRVNTYSGKRTPFLWGLNEPEGMDIAPNGDLIVAEVGAKRLTNINDYANAKNPLRKVIVKDLPIGLDAPLGYPQKTYLTTGVAISMAGDIYFSSDIDGAVYLIENYSVAE